MASTFTQILNITRSGLLARLQNLDIVSHNLSNVNTIGFKRSRANFQEMLNDQIQGGVQLRATQTLMEQGSLRQTDNPLDLAIDGEGFFAIQLPGDRIAYTRDGQLFLDAENQLVIADGFPIIWDGEIPPEAEDVHVNPDGTVMVKQGELWSQAGTIELSRFPNPSGLTNLGGNLWLETDISGEAQTGAPLTEGFGQIMGSALEGSNVNLAEEMTQMVTLQRGFEMSVRTFQQTDQMLSQAIHMRRA